MAPWIAFCWFHSPTKRILLIHFTTEFRSVSFFCHFRLTGVLLISCISFQERQLSRFDKEESDAPAAVQRVSEEANALREQLKRYKEKYDSKTKKLQEVDEELERTQRLLKKMKNLVDDKKLAERDELARKLEKARSELEVKEETAKVYHKNIRLFE